MSPGPAGAVASASPPDTLSFGGRLAGVIRRPRATFASIAAAPRPAPMLVVLAVVPFAISAVFFSTGVGQQALVDQWERTAIAFGQPMDDVRYAELQALSTRGVEYAAATAVVAGPVAAAAVAAVLFGVFTGVRRGAASFRQVLAVVAYAGVILLLRDLVAAPLDYARESVGGATSLVRFVGGFDEASPVARFLALIDPFVVWWLVVLAIGISVLYGERTTGTAAWLTAVYIAGVLLLAVVMAVLGGN